MKDAEGMGPAGSGIWLSGAGLVLAAVLFAFDPARHALYPVCFFHKWTGLLCPGCGGLRAAHQLLHGHLSAAWRLNPLLIGALPLAMVFWSRRVWARLRRQPPPRGLRPAWFWAGIGAALLFGVIRNLPCFAQAGLAP